MSQQSNQQQRQASNNTPPKKEDVFGKFIALGMNLGIFASMITIGLQYFKGVGDEVSCGRTMSSDNVCYLAGWNLDTVVSVTVILLVLLLIGIAYWQKATK